MGLPVGRVDEMLDLVSLADHEADRRVRDDSLGMGQRLGLAHALLGDPVVLILDEPANGLDPAGIRWMRDLLRGHADRGATVLLSSHLLHEIEVVADDLVVIGNGRIAAAGAKTDLLAATGTHARTRYADQLVRALTSAGLSVVETSAASTKAEAGNGSPGPHRTLRVDADPELVGRLAHRSGVPLVELRAADGAGLEEMFLELTADPQRDADHDSHAHTYRQGAVA